MRTVAARLERLERALVVGCPDCGGRVKIVPHYEKVEPPRGQGCGCGVLTIVWCSQAPASLDAALEQAADLPQQEEWS